MNTDTLSANLIQDPQQWRMAMRLGAKALDVIIYSPVNAGNLIYRHFPFDEAAHSPLKALEAIVYDNPLLLADFSRISCEIDSPEFMVLPRGIDDADDDDAEQARTRLFSALFPAFNGQTILSPSGMPQVAIMAGIDGDLAGFLRRSFFNVQISHSLSALTRYFLAAPGRGNAARVFVNLRNDAADIIVISGNRLELVNTFPTPSVSDAAYFLSAVISELQLPDDVEIHVAGCNEMREPLMDMLRKMNRRVMPVIFPSVMFNAGKDAMLAPFDLIVLPLCE